MSVYAILIAIAILAYLAGWVICVRWGLLAMPQLTGRGALGFFAGLLLAAVVSFLWFWVVGLMFLLLNDLGFYWSPPYWVGAVFLCAVYGVAGALGGISAVAFVS